MDLKKKAIQIVEFFISMIPGSVYQRIYINAFPYVHSVSKNSNVSYDYPYFIAKSKGAKEKYCIFRYSMPTYGILAAGVQFLFAASWARKRGMIPLLDIELAYDFETNRLGESNLWDFFFEQPVTVKEALNKDWVLVESFHSRGLFFHPFDIIINNKRNDFTLHMGMDDWRTYFTKVQPYVNTNWKFRENILKKFSSLCEEKIGDGTRVLGILLREELSAEADQYMLSKDAHVVYDKHPRTVGISQTIALTKEKMEEWNCDRVFVATQFQDSVEAFQGVFGEKVIFVDRNRRRLEQLKHENAIWSQSCKEYWEHYHQEDVRKATYENTESYLQEVYILSKCQCFLASKCSGSIAALAMNGGSYQKFYCLPDLNNSIKY